MNDVCVCNCALNTPEGKGVRKKLFLDGELRW